MQIKTDGLIINQKKINENDRYLTILTRDSGVLYAYANGANKIKSPLCSSTSLMSYCDFVLYEQKGRYTVNNADLKNAFFDISHDLENLSLVKYLFDIAQCISVPGSENEMLLRLTLNTLHFLEKKRHDPLILKSIYEIRTLMLGGFSPALIACDQCAAYEAERMYFSVLNGILLCQNCFSTVASREGFFTIDPDLLYSLRYIVFQPFELLFKLNPPHDRAKKLTELTELYVQAQLDRSFPSLNYYYMMRMD